MNRLVAALFLLTTGLVHAETWRFAVIGDVPYSRYERNEMPQLLENIAAEHPEFIIHAGDIKLSSDECTDELFLDRHQLLDSSSVPVIYTPGDNEWTDCRRLSAGRYDEIERLNKLRALFFSGPRSLGKRTVPVEQQSAKTPENLRWRLGPVLFLSLNVPGPNNNFGIGQKPSAEFLARNPLLIEWLKQGFTIARQEHSVGIVIVMQANPGFKHFAAGLGHSGYREMLETLLGETLSFPGEVLLIHGDTHWHRIDHPLFDRERGRRVENFTRLETFGYPIMGWAKVIIDTESPSLFRFESHAYKSEPLPMNP